VKKKARTKRYTAEKLAAMRARGETKSDWKRSAATTHRDIERSIAADPDEAGMIVDWKSASAEMPQPKAVLNMRVDKDVLDHFRKKGRGYQTRINAVLRAFVRAEQHRVR
jgi:uncharacterized protein (DUF4415 family)